MKLPSGDGWNCCAAPVSIRHPIGLYGTSVYEDEVFHRLCDELGLLVWQDMMFANMDYPFGDTGVLPATVRAECAESEPVTAEPSCRVWRWSVGIRKSSSRPECLGLDAQPRAAVRSSARNCHRIAERYCPGIPYVPSAPSGGDLPFRTRRGVANYFGVGAYLRPLDDARRADVGFASECLAFSNVPEAEAMEKMALSIPGGKLRRNHPAWKRAVPRDAGAGWDFEDVRDHYLKLLYGADPLALRYTDARRYWELSRAVSGRVMEEVFGEWRRPDSRCGGGIVLWSSDLEPGAGWGILDSDGAPKPAYWFLKRALAPCAVWTTDEGLNGVDIHVSARTALRGFDGMLARRAVPRAEKKRSKRRRARSGSRHMTARHSE